MEKVIYRGGGGLGLILSKKTEKEVIEPQCITLHGEVLQPNGLSSLDGLFTEPLRFAGLLKNHTKRIMCFYIGSEEDLFSKQEYYYCFHWINEERICNKYTETSARSFIWKNGKWK